MRLDSQGQDSYRDTCTEVVSCGYFKVVFLEFSSLYSKGLPVLGPPSGLCLESWMVLDINTGQAPLLRMSRDRGVPVAGVAGPGGFPHWRTVTAATGNPRESCYHGWSPPICRDGLMEGRQRFPCCCTLWASSALVPRVLMAPFPPPGVCPLWLEAGAQFWEPSPPWVFTSTCHTSSVELIMNFLLYQVLCQMTIFISVYYWRLWEISKKKTTNFASQLYAVNANVCFLSFVLF